jgi:HK97 family phage major capsid protein
MNKQQYLEQRNALLAEAETLVNEAKFDESAQKRDEVTALDETFEKASKELANLNALRDEQAPIDFENNATAVKEGVKIEDMKSNNTTINYEDVFAKVALKRDLTPDEEQVFNAYNPTNVYTHTTTNTEIVIPETVVSGIISTMEELHPILADVRSTRIKGTVKYVKHTGIAAGDADYYDEATATADEENVFGELTLGAKELSKAVTVSWKLQAMAVSDFIPFIQRELGERMSYAKANAFVRGAGDAKYPQGIITALDAQADKPQIAEYAAETGITYKDITSAMAKLKSKYAGGAKIYANNATIWNQLANIVDGNGRPIFIADATVGGAGRIFGIPVAEEDAINDGEVLFGNVSSGYTENVQEAMTLTTEQHAKGRTTDFVGYEVHDAGVTDEFAFALVRPTTVPAG